MKIEKLDIKTVSFFDKNPRIHSKNQIQALKQSILLFGQLRPAVVDENNVCLAGNGMLSALLELGETEIYCVRVLNLKNSDKKRLVLADNRIFELGSTDYNIQHDLLKDIVSNDKNIEIPGFDPDFIKNLVIQMPDINHAITNYGVMTDQVKNDSLQSVTSGHINDFDDEQMTRTEQNKSVNCPHCGELIWL